MEKKGVEESEPCCISHLFSRAASANPSKIAVIHGHGGARMCRESRAKMDDFGFNMEEHFDRHRKFSSPPVYHGDECFNMEEISTAADSLCSRIRRVLDGGDDPNLIRRKAYIRGRVTANDQISESSKFVSISGGHSTNSQSECSSFVPDASIYIGNVSGETYGTPSLTVNPHIIGIYVVPSVEYIITVLSVLRCGEAFLPLDPLWPKDRILSIVSASMVSLIITCTSSSDANNNHLGKANWLVDQSNSSVLCISPKTNLKEQIQNSELGWPCESGRQRRFCYLLYTSGSTGKPKGVCGTEKGLLNRFLWMQALFPLQGTENLLFKTSISFVDHLQEFLSAVLTCTPLVIPPFDELKENPFYLVDFLKAYCVSRLTAVPTLMRSILPAMRSPQLREVQEFLKVLVLSGDVLTVSLWEILSNLLPKTTILNLYGSTEVSGDCTYFDCKRLPTILDAEALRTVPIGVPISNCDIVLIGEPDMPNEGELHVGGLCISSGYIFDPVIMSSDYVMLTRDSGPQLYFKTGDFARQLQSGDFIFLGRKDRTIKVNGQRVAIEEIENVLREHSDVADAAVTFHTDKREVSYLVAHLVFQRNKCWKEQNNHDEENCACDRLSFSIRSWLARKLSQAMIPTHYLCMKSLPMTPSGKVDYTLLASSTFGLKRTRDEIDGAQYGDGLLEVIKGAFRDALMVEEVANLDDLFLMGGNSIAAAQVSHKLGIDMRLIYMFPSPTRLLNALLDKRASYRNVVHAFDLMANDLDSYKSLRMSIQAAPVGRFQSSLQKPSSDQLNTLNHGSSLNLDSFKKLSSLHRDSVKGTTLTDTSTWISNFHLPEVASFSRCNKVMYATELEVNNVRHSCFSVKVPRDRSGVMQELWTVCLRSCVDASPLIVVKDGNAYLFIGSHFHNFLCIDAVSGLVRWDVELEGRVECSAAITGDFNQVVVGCYKGKIYFLDFMSGSICWVFQTGDEVKSQPVVDKCKQIVWCGSHDHNLYALDYANHHCIYKVSCGGSIYGSPSIDRDHDMLYVASTSGRVTGISFKEEPFSILWLHETGMPIFGSLFVTSPNGNVICCLVNGHVIALDFSGSVIWKVSTGGPIFAGACISPALPSQVLICSRDGVVYSFETEGGGLLWEYHMGEPLTSSAYIDEHIELLSDPSHSPDRLACVCSSSGKIHVLRINPDAIEKKNQMEATGPLAQKFATMDLPGEIFSSPVMIGGRMFVGCRDDNVHCIGVI